MNNKEKGYLGEKIACTYLDSKGFNIIERNYTTRTGEIDIIAMLEGEIVFVEVKSRMNLNFGYGRDSISKNKVNKIINTAKHYMFIRNIYNTKIRFDVVEIYFKDKKINHIQNAF